MIKAIVTDIEGTTSSISFVKDVLFPYAARHLPEYTRQHWEEPAVREQLLATSRESGLEADDIESLIDQLLQWIEQDKKATPLKALQGMVWKAGYESGDYQAHVYPDVAGQLKNWHDAGISLYVYSSGSIAAQKLFFRHSEAGDLTPLFIDYFDTTTGPKQESASYSKIADSIELPPEQILFLSDIEAELDAAQEAGLRTIQVIRQQDSAGNEENGQSSHPTVPDFDRIKLDSFR